MEEQPSPKSLPGYVGLYVEHRQQAELQVLEKEITFLQKELKSLGDIQPTSRCCKELSEFLAKKSDPLIAVNKKSTEPNCTWKIISGCFQCCFSREHSCRKCRGLKDCYCFHQNCSFFRLSRPRNCCKLKLCPDCVVNYCGFCC